MKILVLNGPNLNSLGTREPEIYGYETLADIETKMTACAALLGGGIELDFRQTNSEAELIAWIGETRNKSDGIIINPAALTHTSLPQADALKAVAAVVLAVEVPLINTHAREEVRINRLTASAGVSLLAGCQGFGQILGRLRAANKIGVTVPDPPPGPGGLLRQLGFQAFYG